MTRCTTAKIRTSVLYGFSLMLMTIVATLSLFTANLVAKERLPVPSGKDLAKSQEVMLETYGAAKKAATTKDKKVSLGRQFLREASDSTKPSDVWSLLLEAKLKAQEAYEVELLQDVCRSMGDRFEYDPFEDEVQGLVNFPVANLSPAESTASTYRLLKLLPDALRRHQFSAVTRITQTAVEHAKQTGDTNLAAEVSGVSKEILEIKPLFESAASAASQLPKEPLHAGANAAAARFTCFVIGDWRGGLTYLALGNERAAQELALMELRPTIDINTAIKLADGWWELATGRTDIEQKMIRRHAAAWYKSKIAELKGLDKSKAEARIRQAELLVLPLFVGQVQYDLALARGKDPFLAAPIPDEPTKPKTIAGSIEPAPSSTPSNAIIPLQNNISTDSEFEAYRDLPATKDGNVLEIQLASPLKQEVIFSLNPSCADTPVNQSFGLAKNLRVSGVWDVLYGSRASADAAVTSGETIAKFKVNDAGKLMFAWLPTAKDQPSAVQLINCVLNWKNGEHSYRLYLRTPQPIAQETTVLYDGGSWEKQWTFANPPSPKTLKAELKCVVNGEPKKTTAALGKRGSIRHNDFLMGISLVQKDDIITMKIKPGFVTVTGKEEELSPANVKRLGALQEQNLTEMQGRIVFLTNATVPLSRTVASIQSRLNSTSNEQAKSQLEGQLIDAQKDYSDTVNAIQTTKRKLAEGTGKLKKLVEISKYLEANVGGMPFEISLVAETPEQTIRLLQNQYKQ